MKKHDNFPGYGEKSKQEIYNAFVEREAEFFDAHKVSQEKINTAVLLIAGELDRIAHSAEDNNRTDTLRLLSSNPKKLEGQIAWAAKAFSTAVASNEDLKPFWDYKVLYEQVLKKITDPFEREILKKARGILSTEPVQEEEAA
jgi:hypothetical protein